MMERIDRHNYEAFYLDYLEGNLNAQGVAELLLFLENHPEFKSELEDTELITLDASPTPTFDKSSLHQEINAENVEDYIIASIENQIDEDDAEELSTYLSQSKEAKQLADRYKKTILPRKEVPFPEKHKLKRRAAPIYLLAPILTAAAVALILLFVNIPGNEAPMDPGIATEIITPPKDKPEVKDLKDENVIATVENEIPEKEIQTIEEKEKRIQPRDLKEQNPAMIENDSEIATQTPKDKKEIVIPFVHEVIVQSNNDQAPDPEPNAILDKNREPEEVAQIIPQQPTLLNIDTVRVQAKERIAEIAQKDFPKIVIDTSAVKTTERIAVSEIAVPSNDALTVGEWANKSIRKKVLKEKNNSTKRIKRNEVIAAVVDKIDESTPAKIDYKYKKEKGRSAMSISVGKFKFYRTKSK